MKILSVVGARPQFIKAAALSRKLRKSGQEILVHTGQHYDENMSDIFFSELDIPEPHYRLEIGPASHATQTGNMLIALEQVMAKERPKIVLVYGDTNSTIAAALTASKMGIPIAHVEAGLRSFNRSMPEEINRIVTDRLSTWLFAPSDVGVSHLKNEGISSGVYNVGDIMYESVLANAERAAQVSQILTEQDLKRGQYFFATVHRAENTDSADRLGRIFYALGAISNPIIMPLHPRTKKRLAEHSISIPKNVKAIDPTGYFDTLQLVQCSIATITDSGGLQKECYYLKRPCLTLRDETEWVETVELGWNRICGVDSKMISEGAEWAKAGKFPRWVPIYGDGKTSDLITKLLVGS